ncbi:MAG: hypothetical protein Greene041679_58 [Parcubacteria group bacterium Greene0416_79]|nr:MAG: hypothetical protein Greene041679_58 [Parcubacteria group bacterium Greene0416_79]
MKLFIINWGGKELGMIEAVRELKKEHRIAYWTCANIAKEVVPKEFPETVLHEHMDALHGIPARGLSCDIPPVDPELLEKLYETESLVLTMMNKHFEKKTVSERKFLYHTLVGYWDAILKRYRPDAVVFPTVPHSVYDFVIYALARRSGIRTVMMEPTWVGDRMIVMSDYLHGQERADSLIVSDSLDGLPSDLRREYELHRQAGADATPVFVRDIKRRYSGAGLLFIKARSMLTTLFAHKDFSVLPKVFSAPFKRFRPNLKKEYERVAVGADFSKPYLYFPLHYQPERNSSPQGGIFVDQILLVGTLSAALPEGWTLYVKEHPTQWLYRGFGYFSYRFKGYYKAVAKIKNVRVVPIETSTYDLTKHALAVATITGTAGFEAVMRRKPVLVFGYPWYRHAPGIFKVRSVSSCQEAIRKIINGFSISESDLVEYLHHFDAATFHGYIDRDGQKVSVLSPEENARALAGAIASVFAKSA